MMNLGTELLIDLESQILSQFHTLQTTYNADFDLKPLVTAAERSLKLQQNKFNPAPNETHSNNKR